MIAVLFSLLRIIIPPFQLKIEPLKHSKGVTLQQIWKWEILEKNIQIQDS
jgi:hypothetical protein